MSRRTIHIANLRIRIPRGMAGEATAIARGLGREILQGIAEATKDQSGSTQLAATDPVGVRGSRQQVATTVAQTLRKRIG